MKGQTWIEFIIATAIFLFSISFIFINATGSLKEEIQKSQLQTSCLQTYELESLLQQTGIPTNWNSASGFSVFGLAQRNNTSIIVSHSKWQAMKYFGFANVSQNSTPSQSWNIKYDAYAFELIPDSAWCVDEENAITICRTSDTLMVTANSSLQSQTSLKLFFPLSSITNMLNQTDSNDIVQNSSDANGAYLNLALNTNSTNQDYVKVALSPVPKLVFIEQFNVANGQNLKFVLGNKTYALLQDNFGATPPPNAMVCTTKVSGLLNLTPETLAVTYNLEAW